MNPLRLLFGTLTVFPVRPPTSVDRLVAGRAMVLAPFAGLVLALAVLVPWWLSAAGFSALSEADVFDASGPGPLVTAVLVSGALALLTRGMHLDGLADVADGLGSGRRGDAAVEVMRKSDIGPFGVVTLVLVLLLQVGALAEHISRGTGPLVLVLALVLSRLVLPILCTPVFPAASASGLGRTMAGSVSGPRAGLSACLAALGLLLGGGLVLALDGPSPVFGVDSSGLSALLVLGVLGLAPAIMLALRARSRFGGVTGDVYGATVETAYTAILVLTLLAP